MERKKKESRDKGLGRGGGVGGREKERKRRKLVLDLHKVRGTVPTGGEGLALGPADWHRRKKIMKERQRERERDSMYESGNQERERERLRGGKDTEKQEGESGKCASLGHVLFRRQHYYYFLNTSRIPGHLIPLVRIAPLAFLYFISLPGH